MKRFLRKGLPLFLGLLLLATVSQAAEKISPGEISQAVEFSLPDLDSRMVSVANYRNEKSVLIIFWTSWCPYCLAGLKDLNAKYGQLLNDDIEVLAINAGEARSKAARVAKNYKLLFRVLLDEEGAVSDYFDVIGVPLYVLLDQKGRVIFSDNFYPKQEIKKLSAK
jgi:cytochrome c biogenesis protein CcmG/thiol:disulfide interchange protein DsbE